MGTGYPTLGLSVALSGEFMYISYALVRLRNSEKGKKLESERTKETLGVVPRLKVLR
jgi:hypothetical protein